MNATYLHMLAKDTPPLSTLKSNYIRHYVSSGSTKKGLSFENLTSDSTLQPDDPSSSLLNAGNEISSRISGVFERDLTGVSKNEYDASFLLERDPDMCSTDYLYEEFLDFFLGYAGEHEIFNLLQNYEELCCKYILKLMKVLAKTVSVENKIYKTANMLHFLQEERNTWRLLRILFKDRLVTETIDEGGILMNTVGKRMSDKQIVDHLYDQDAYIRQSQLIVDWLEKNAAEDFQDTFYNQFDCFTDNCLALEHSLSDLTTNATISKNLRGFSDLELDPDSVLRQKNYPLHEADKENETRLFKYMFMCIRAGKLDQAQQLAERFGEPWLAAALEGWRLYHDPNYDNENIIEGEALLPVEGNKYRDLWKMACWEACETPAVSVYEQSVYGSICGNLKAVLAVCKTWEDYLWAYIRSSLDKLIEQEIRECTQQGRSLEKMPPEYWDKKLDIAEIFQELEASNPNEVKVESKSVFHVMQKYIILDDLDGLIEEMFSWLNSRKLDGHVLRSMVHLILFLRVIGRSTKEELCVPVLEAYVQELIKAHRVSLVAPYTSTLPKEQQIVWYAKFLEGITDNSERQKCLQYAEDAGLNISLITRTVVKNIREKEPERVEMLSDLSAVTTEDDKKKIHAIDWLTFDPTQRAEAMKQANALMRVFVAQRKIEAARLLFDKIPSDSVAVMMQLAKSNGFEELSADDDNATREYLCFKAYLEAIDEFNNWFSHSIHGKPKEPRAPSGEHISFKEKVAYEHELQQYEKDLERWHSVVTGLASTASEHLYNVLLFVDGGWMVDQRMGETTDECRQLQLSRLRKLCIPQVTHLLQDLLIHEGKYKEAIQLADIISSERYQLYKEFTHEDIKQFLQVTLDSSIALLDKNLDPLGYSYQQNELQLS